MYEYCILCIKVLIYSNNLKYRTHADALFPIMKPHAPDLHSSLILRKTKKLFVTSQAYPAVLYAIH